MSWWPLGFWASQKVEPAASIAATMTTRITRARVWRASSPSTQFQPHLLLPLLRPSAAAASSSELQLPFAPRPKPSARPIAREPEDLESTFLLGVSRQLPRSDSFELAVIEFDPEFERAILKARVAGEFEALVPRLLLPAANHPSLDSLNPTWTPVARIGRALRAGISARRVLSGQFSKQAQSPHLPFKNKIYVCLRCLRLRCPKDSLKSRATCCLMA